MSAWQARQNVLQMYTASSRTPVHFSVCAPDFTSLPRRQAAGDFIAGGACSPMNHPQLAVGKPTTRQSTRTMGSVTAMGITERVVTLRKAETASSMTEKGRHLGSIMGIIMNPGTPRGTRTGGIRMFLVSNSQ